MNNLLDKLMFFPERSLFDGMCCGRLALEKAGIPVKKYYASEIKNVAIQNTMRNYPMLFGWKIEKIFGGFRCTRMTLFYKFPC